MDRLVASNVSQTLFNEDEKTNGTLSLKEEQKFSFLGNINPIYANDQNMKAITPIFLDQSRLSTYYQDNPWNILTYSRQFDNIPIMGGDINPSQSPGYRPGNTYENAVKGKERFGNAGESSGSCSVKYIVMFILLVLFLVAIYYFFKNK